MNSVEQYRKEYFDNYLSNPYSLGYFQNIYLKEEHKEEEIVERGILCIYNYLKYIIRHFDNGYSNFGTSIGLDSFIPQIPESVDDNKYRKYMKFLESEELYSTEFLMFSIAFLLREKDPFDKKKDFADYTFPNTHMYPTYRLLVLAHEKKINITFIEAMDIIMSNSPYYYNEKTHMSEKEYFTKTYDLLVYSLKKAKSF